MKAFKFVILVIFILNIIYLDFFILYHGSFNEKDIDKHTISEHLSLNSMEKLMLMYKDKNNKAARHWAMMAYDNGSLIGGENLATMYRYRIGGERDMAKAIDIYLDVAKKGSIYSVHSLGEIYFLGDGVKENKEKGIKYFRLACENGNEESCLFLRMNSPRAVQRQETGGR
ncbi:tetratricopeptide repeat protein [Serratia ureilytica]|uniref:tetratricopeptide repeat protein n=1 Tax=Serratia ureilytica TaxID=300181 RepID=UPI00313BD313